MDMEIEYSDGKFYERAYDSFASVTRDASSSKGKKRLLNRLKKAAGERAEVTNQNELRRTTDEAMRDKRPEVLSIEAELESFRNSSEQDQDRLWQMLR